MLINGVEEKINSTTLFYAKNKAQIALILSGLICAGGLSAAEWTNEFGATATAVHTDNVGLRESDEESDLIFNIAPYWNVRGEGGRINFETYGSIEAKDIGGGRNANNISYQADADAELVERILFLDLSATASQNAIDPLSKSGSDNLSDTNNTTTTYTAKISPYVRGRIKRYANFEARFDYSYVTNDEIDDGDTRTRDLTLSLDSGTEFGDFSWSINGERSRTTSQTGSETDKSSVDVNVGQQLNRQWQINATVGKEWTDFTSNGDTDGNFWEVGTIWTPSERTLLDVGYGRRFSGKTGHLDFSHRSKRSVITASYSQEVTNNSDLLANQVLFSPLDPFGEPVNPISSDPIAIADGTFLNNINNTSQFLNDRFAASYTFQGKRTTIKVDADYTKQTSGDESETSAYGVGVSFDRDLTGLLSANAGIFWDTQKAADDSESDITKLNVGLNQKLSKKTSVSLSYTHTKRDSDTAGDSYDEDRVTLSLRHDL